ncbi:MAG: winged helix DNA-binding protein, partial [Desulfobacterales bacterium]
SDAGTPIVSSAHLVSERAAELSEFEYGLIVADNAFARWIMRCMAAAGQSELGALDVLVLHSVNHRGRAKRLSDLSFVLNVEDSHTVTYALKKLVRLGLVAGARQRRSHTV